MRRAVSTAYYALFHALARLCADELVGVSHGHSQEWARVYRALDHRTAKVVLSSADAARLGSAVAQIGASLSDLQERRHQADYDPAFFSFYFDETEALIELAASAIADLDRLDADQRRSLAIMLIVKKRSDGRP